MRRLVRTLVRRCTYAPGGFHGPFPALRTTQRTAPLDATRWPATPFDTLPQAPTATRDDASSPRPRGRIKYAVLGPPTERNVNKGRDPLPGRDPESPHSLCCVAACSSDQLAQEC